MICKHILLMIFLNEPELILFLLMLKENAKKIIVMWKKSSLLLDRLIKANLCLAKL